MKLTLNSDFDPDEALAIVEGDRDLFLELVNVFRESYPLELSSIRDAIDLGDSEALRRASHHFKGTLSALAAGPASDVAVRLEAMGRSAELDQAAVAYAQMEQLVQALVGTLSHWIETIR
jgi:HPt (histidine-containing phosphotransfer) domain-containing protein